MTNSKSFSPREPDFNLSPPSTGLDFDDVDLNSFGNGFDKFFSDSATPPHVPTFLEWTADPFAGNFGLAVNPQAGDSHHLDDFGGYLAPPKDVGASQPDLQATLINQNKSITTSDAATQLCNTFFGTSPLSPTLHPVHHADPRPSLGQYPTQMSRDTVSTHHQPFKVTNSNTNNKHIGSHSWMSASLFQPVTSLAQPEHDAPYNRNVQYSLCQTNPAKYSVFQQDIEYQNGIDNQQALAYPHAFDLTSVDPFPYSHHTAIDDAQVLSRPEEPLLNLQGHDFNFPPFPGSSNFGGETAATQQSANSNVIGFVTVPSNVMTGAQAGSGGAAPMPQAAQQTPNTQYPEWPDIPREGFLLFPTEVLTDRAKPNTFEQEANGQDWISPVTGEKVRTVPCISSRQLNYRSVQRWPSLLILVELLGYEVNDIIARIDVRDLPDEIEACYQSMLQLTGAAKEVERKLLKREIRNNLTNSKAAFRQKHLLGMAWSFRTEASQTAKNTLLNLTPEQLFHNTRCPINHTTRTFSAAYRYLGNERIVYKDFPLEPTRLLDGKPLEMLKTLGVTPPSLNAYLGEHPEYLGWTPDSNHTGWSPEYKVGGPPDLADPPPVPQTNPALASPEGTSTAENHALTTPALGRPTPAKPTLTDSPLIDQTSTSTNSISALAPFANTPSANPTSALPAFAISPSANPIFSNPMSTNSPNLNMSSSTNIFASQHRTVLNTNIHPTVPPEQTLPSTPTPQLRVSKTNSNQKKRRREEDVAEQSNTRTRIDQNGRKTKKMRASNAAMPNNSNQTEMNPVEQAKRSINLNLPVPSNEYFAANYHKYAADAPASTRNSKIVLADLGFGTMELELVTKLRFIPKSYHENRDNSFDRAEQVGLERRLD